MMNIYLIIVLCLIGFDFVFDAIKEWLNLRHAGAEIPDEFRDVCDADRYARSQAYLRDTTRFGLLKGALMTPASIAFILLGGFGWIDHIVRSAGLSMIPTGLLFAAILTVIGLLVNLPFSVYSTFVIEERYGFNKTTPRTFVLDLLKSLLLSAIIGVPLFAGLLWFFAGFAGWAWLISWGVVTVCQFGLTFIAPVLILPLFNRFTPLEEGALRTEIEQLARSQDFKVQGIFMIDGSRRSAKANAYFTGLGRTKRIALFDTLIEKHTVPELLAVLAHEVGHCKLRHIVTSIVVSVLSNGLMFYILSLFIAQPGLYRAFGVDPAPIGAAMPIYAGFVFFGFLYAPIDMILSLFCVIMSRRHEYQADAFVRQAGLNPEALISALKKLTVDSLGNLTPHPMKVFFDYSHPPVLKRIRALRETAE